MTVRSLPGPWWNASRGKGAPFLVLCLGLVGSACGMPGETANGARTADTAECASCQIVLRSVATLEDAEGDRLDDNFRVLERNGQFLVGGVGEADAQIAVYSRSGEFVEFIGSPGQGPGEFHRIRELALDPDLGRVVVLNNKLSELDSALSPGVVATEVDYLTAWRITRRQDGWAVNSYRGEAPLIFVGEDLEVQRRVGTTSTDPDSNQFILAGDGEGGLWAARAMYAYELRHYDRDGQLVATIRPGRTWFADWQHDPETADFSRFPFKPRMTALWQMPDGRLMALIIREDAAFVAAPAADEGAPGMVGPDEYPTYLDSTIEIIDPENGALLATQQLDGVWAGFTGDGKVWRIAQSGDTTRVELAEVVVR